jgi:hypothetical protein
MSRRLFHFVLAVVVAFVFTGRMEAAASHCRGLVAPTDMATNMANMDMVGADMSAMPDCHGADHPGKTHSPANDPCECLALLTADCPTIATPRVSVRIAPFNWERPTPMAITSFDRAPDEHPPKA